MKKKNDKNDRTITFWELYGSDICGFLIWLSIGIFFVLLIGILIFYPKGIFYIMGLLLSVGIVYCLYELISYIKYFKKTRNARKFKYRIPYTVEQCRKMRITSLADYLLLLNELVAYKDGNTICYYDMSDSLRCNIEIAIGRIFNTNYDIWLEYKNSKYYVEHFLPNDKMDFEISLDCKEDVKMKLEGFLLSE